MSAFIVMVVSAQRPFFSQAKPRQASTNNEIKPVVTRNTKLVDA
jgi:hypothetical protein